MKEITLNVTTVGDKSEFRTLRANWIQEIIQDINFHHGVSIEIEKILRIEKRKNSIKNIFSE